MCWCTPGIRTPCCGEKCHVHQGIQADACGFHAKPSKPAHTVNIEVKQTGLDDIENRLDRLVAKSNVLKENLLIALSAARELDSDTSVG